MNEIPFIELAIKYLDSTATAEDVEQLNAAMLDNPERRSVYRDLVQQSQLSHEWQAGAIVPRKSRSKITKLAVASVAAAAAAILLAMAVLHSQNADPTHNPVASAPEIPDYFKGKGPSWQEIYPSLFDRPNFAWRAEFRQAPDVFSEGGMPPVPTATSDSEFSERIAPIAMFPDNYVVMFPDIGEGETLY